MADVNVNTGVAHRWENSGKVRIGSSGSGFLPLLIVPGSLSVKFGGRTQISYRDRSAFAGVLPGVEQQSEITFQVRPTKNGLTGANDLRNKLFQAVNADGSTGTYAFEVDWLDSDGAATGTRCAFALGHVNGGFTIKTSEEDTDMLEVTVTCADGTPTWSAF